VSLLLAAEYKGKWFAPLIDNPLRRNPVAVVLVAPLFGLLGVRVRHGRGLVLEPVGRPEIPNRELPSFTAED
jgi:hypothetical protein